MYTIGQFSRICSVTTKALRHYEQIGLLRPARVNADNQYRLYAAEQIEAVRLIRTARMTGMSLQMIKAVLAQAASARPLGDLLEMQRRALVDELRELNHRLARLDWWTKRQEVESMDGTKHYAVTLRELPAITVRSRRQVVTDYPRGVIALFRSILTEIEAAGKAPAGAPFVMYYDEEYNPERVDVEVAWPVSDPALVTNTIPATAAAVTMHVGSYEELVQAYAAVFAWVNQNGYAARYPMRDVYHNDPSTAPPEELVTEVILPIRGKGE